MSNQLLCVKTPQSRWNAFFIIIYLKAWSLEVDFRASFFPLEGDFFFPFCLQ